MKSILKAAKISAGIGGIAFVGCLLKNTFVIPKHKMSEDKYPFISMFFEVRSEVDNLYRFSYYAPQNFRNCCERINKIMAIFASMESIEDKRKLMNLPRASLQHLSFAKSNIREMKHILTCKEQNLKKDLVNAFLESKDKLLKYLENYTTDIQSHVQYYVGQN